MRILTKLAIVFTFSVTTLFGGSYECHFTKKISYSSKRDKTPNKIRRVSMWVIYRVVGNELLTKPESVDRTFTAYATGKFLSRDGTLYYGYESNKGYLYHGNSTLSSIKVTP